MLSVEVIKLNAIAGRIAQSRNTGECIKGSDPEKVRTGRGMLAECSSMSPVHILLANVPCNFHKVGGVCCLMDGRFPTN